MMMGGNEYVSVCGGRSLAVYTYKTGVKETMLEAINLANDVHLPVEYGLAFLCARVETIE